MLIIKHVIFKIRVIVNLFTFEPSEHAPIHMQEL